MAIPDKTDLTSEELVRSWGLEPRAAPIEEVVTRKALNPSRGGGLYLTIGGILGALIGFVTFVGAYIYCISEYGFLFGFGLGWLPSGILAAIVGQLVRFLWGPIILLVALVIARMSIH